MNTTTLAPAAPKALSAGMTLLLASACGLIVANLYYAQPLIGPIGAELGLSPSAAGLIVTLTQIGYGLGLLLIVPLGDLFENRKLILTLSGIVAVSLVAASLSSHPLPFLGAAFCIGIGSVAVQVLVPYAAHLSPEATRGQAVGNVMSGLMIGIMLARPISGFVTEFTSWHVLFAAAAAVVVLTAGVLAFALPRRVPRSPHSYGALLASMGRLVRDTPVLRRRALYQACLFGTFSLFWTTIPLVLGGPDFGLSHSGVALFALAGVAGAIAAPFAGRLADRGWTRPATLLSMLVVIAAYLMTHAVPLGSTLSLGLLVAAAILIDYGVTTNLVLGQRAIFALGAEMRSRLNGLYMATFFVGGAAGSAAGAWAYAQGGWRLASMVGAALPVAGLIYASTESWNRGRRRVR